MNRETFFSVIIPTFNRAQFLKIAIDSVCRQTFRKFELIVIDDGSTDNTKQLVNSYTDKRIVYLHQANRGPSGARNKGLEISKGEYISFLDSDDSWTSEKLEKTKEFIDNFPDIKIFHTDEKWFCSGKLLNQKKKHKKPTGFVYKYALPLCCISISTCAVKREVFDTIDAFDESFPACEDYDFWLRATSKYEVKLIPEELTLKDGGRQDQLSSSVWGLDRFRIKALEKMLNSKTLSKENYSITYEELKRKCSFFSSGARKRGKVDESVYYQKLPDKYKLQ